MAWSKLFGRAIESWRRLCAYGPSPVQRRHVSAIPAGNGYNATMVAIAGNSRVCPRPPSRESGAAFSMCGRRAHASSQSRRNGALEILPRTVVSDVIDGWLPLRVVLSAASTRRPEADRSDGAYPSSPELVGAHFRDSACAAHATLKPSFPLTQC